MQEPRPPAHSYRKTILIVVALFVATVAISVCIWAGITSRRNNSKSNASPLVQSVPVSLAALEEPTVSPSGLHVNSTESTEQATMKPIAQPTVDPLPTASPQPTTVSFVPIERPTMPPTRLHVNSTESPAQSTLTPTGQPAAFPALATSTQPPTNSLAASEAPAQSTPTPTAQPISNSASTISTQPAPFSLLATEEPTIPSTLLNSTESPTQSALTPTGQPTGTLVAPQVDGNMCTTEEELFKKHKQEIDAVCGRSSLAQDGGAQCKEACGPRFSDCCDPFGVNPVNDTCSFDKNAAGCVAFSKCQALSGEVDAAPANLPDICSLDRIARDEDACKTLCSKTRCCYSIGSDNCLTENFGICLDYAPCQNLRALSVGRSSILPTAPRVLDFYCFLHQPTCAEICETAKCCSDPGAAGCFQFNFVSCLTYAPCNNVTTTNIEIAPQFSYVDKPPDELVDACNVRQGPILDSNTERTCAQYCGDAACCWDTNSATNCFHRDPLGCLAWNGQCQELSGRRLVDAINSTDPAIPCASLSSCGIVSRKMDPVAPPNSTIYLQSAKLQVAKNVAKVPCGSLNNPVPHPLHFPTLPTFPSIPCPDDPACNYVMGALDSVFPASTRLLLNIPGTCQNWAREWLRTEKEVLEFQINRIRQRYTLALLYCEFKGHTWANAPLWLSDLHECDWYGMIGFDPCSRNKEYQIIRNFGQQISGTLPPELSMLSSLWEVNLPDNLLSGSIPSDYAKLSQLDTLVLSLNLLDEGPIPDLIWQYEDMNYLDLAYNSFTGTLSASVHLTEPNLKTLLLEHNYLSGTMPSGFGTLDWKRLDLAGNKFTGYIPKDLNAPNFEDLRLHNNKFIGTFPADSFANDYNGVSKLKVITLYHNNLTGSVDEMCNLLFNGKLELFEVDIHKVDCKCCAGSPYGS